MSEFPFFLLYRQARPELLIARVSCCSEGQIRQRIFVSAVHLGGSIQARQLIQRLAHHLRISFKETPTTSGEKRVTAEHQGPDAVHCCESDMIQSVSWHFNYRQFNAEKLERVCIGDGFSNPLNLAGTGPDHSGLAIALQFRQASGVVFVMMCNQDMTKRKSMLLGMLDNRRRITGVNNSQFAVLLIGDGPYVVVRKAGMG